MSSFAWYRLKKAYPVSPNYKAGAVPAVLAAHYRTERGRRNPLKRSTDLAVNGLFHVWAPLRARQVARACGHSGAWTKRATEIARQCYFDPLDIALYHIQSPLECAPYLRRFEWTAITKRINRRTWSPHCALVDKLLFAERCAEADLPHPRVLGFRRGSEVSSRRGFEGEAFCKPIGGYGGKRASLTTIRSDQELSNHLARDTMAQERLRAHPDLSDLTGEALLTARIITMLDERGAPEIVSTALRLPLKSGAIVDNGALIAPIDQQTGAIGAARLLWAMGDVTRRWSRHPLTDAALRGRILPEWEDAKTLARYAHQVAFGDYALIGWDVGLTARGPVLIEGNGKPSVTITQRASAEGVWGTRMGDLIARHLGLPR